MVSAQPPRTSQPRSSRERPQSEVVLSPKTFPDDLDLLDGGHLDTAQHVQHSTSTPDIAYQTAAGSAHTSQIFVPLAISEENEAPEESTTNFDGKGSDTVDGSDPPVTQKESRKENSPTHEVCPVVGGLLWKPIASKNYSSMHCLPQL